MVDKLAGGGDDIPFDDVMARSNRSPIFAAFMSGMNPSFRRTAPRRSRPSGPLVAMEAEAKSRFLHSSAAMDRT
jgi:hypothetical protein